MHGLPAANGSRSLAGFAAAEDCACAAPLVEAGAIIVGRTSNPEFCYRGVTSNDLWGETRNPHDPSRTAGGPSGGAAASASGMAPLAIGTDGGGSIRIPSALCGTTGLKPTFGLIPKMPGFGDWPTPVRSGADRHRRPRPRAGRHGHGRAVVIRPAELSIAVGRLPRRTGRAGLVRTARRFLRRPRHYRAGPGHSGWFRPGDRAHRRQRRRAR